MLQAENMTPGDTYGYRYTLRAGCRLHGLVYAHGSEDGSCSLDRERNHTRTRWATRTITVGHSKWNLWYTQKPIYLTILTINNNIRPHQVLTMVPRNINTYQV